MHEQIKEVLRVLEGTQGFVRSTVEEHYFTQKSPDMFLWYCSCSKFHDRGMKVAKAWKKEKGID